MLEQKLKQLLPMLVTPGRSASVRLEQRANANAGRLVTSGRLADVTELMPEPRKHESPREVALANVMESRAVQS